MDNYLFQGYVFTRICLIISRITEWALNRYVPNTVEGVDVNQGRTNYILGKIQIIYCGHKFFFSLKSDMLWVDIELGGAVWVPITD